MKRLFYPESVVVIGVSSAPDNLAKNIVQNLVKFGFKGPIYAVGASEGELDGRKIYKSVLDLPTQVEFASFLIPAHLIPNILDECGQKGVRRFVVSSSGFTELYPDRRELEQQLLDVVRRYNMRFVGPNCIGITNLDNGLVVPFAPLSPKMLVKGHNSVIAQSGGVATRCASLFSDEGVGISKVISVGNKLNTDESDLLDFLIDDPSTHAIFMYLEDVRRGRRFIDVARRSSKPIVVMKANTSNATAEIAMSHTTALAGDDRVVDAAFNQAGILRVKKLEGFTSIAKAFALPPCKGDNIVVLSPSGGFAVISADVCTWQGFRLPKLPPDLLKAMEARQRAHVIHLTNPMDFGDTYDRAVTLSAVEEVLKLPDIAAMAVTVQGGGSGSMGFSGPDMKELVYGVKELCVKSGKPVAAAVFARQGDLGRLMQDVDFPIFGGIEEAIEALAIQRRFWKFREGLNTGV